MKADELREWTVRVEAKIDRLLVLQAKAGNGGATNGDVAPDSDLDGEHGNPVIRRDPKRWEGESMVGRCYSDTSPEFLDCLAGFLEWSAKNPREGKEKYADYDRRDAARARGWAKRLRAGWRAAPAAAVDDPFGHDDEDALPFS
jgi:hypothetical protein